MSRPVILKGLVPIARESAPTSDDVYDEVRQAWIHRKTGRLLVEEFTQPSGQTTGPVQSKFGETISTRTMEGTDQTEGSRFGETIITETREGTDQSEIASAISRFGETIKTSTQEGTDQPERSAG